LRGIQSYNWLTGEEPVVLTVWNHFQATLLFFGEKPQTIRLAKLKGRNMGWNQVKHTINHPLWADMR